jgi:hypothetical protein
MNTKVLKKFLIMTRKYENKRATTPREVMMLAEMMEILSRSRATVIEDLVGVVALFSLLVLSLHVLSA